jgi:hypothetical protein
MKNGVEEGTSNVNGHQKRGRTTESVTIYLRFAAAKTFLQTRPLFF